MFEIKVTIDAPELSSAINALALSFAPKCVCTPENQPVNESFTQGNIFQASAATIPAEQPTAVIPIGQPVQPVIPIQTTTVPFNSAPPVLSGQTPAPAVVPGVPVAPATYTMEQLAVAATQLVDAGKRTDLVALLGQFGVPALTALPKEQYGAFATSLRQMGAQI